MGEQMAQTRARVEKVIKTFDDALEEVKSVKEVVSTQDTLLQELLTIAREVQEQIPICVQRASDLKKKLIGHIQEVQVASVQSMAF